MIKQLDLSLYGEQNIKELEALCQQKLLVSAVFYIQMSQETFKEIENDKIK